MEPSWAVWFSYKVNKDPFRLCPAGPSWTGGRNSGGSSVQILPSSPLHQTNKFSLLIHQTDRYQIGSSQKNNQCQAKNDLEGLIIQWNIACYFLQPIYIHFHVRYFFHYVLISKTSRSYLVVAETRKSKWYSRTSFSFKLTLFQENFVELSIKALKLNSK